MVAAREKQQVIVAAVVVAQSAASLPHRVTVDAPECYRRMFDVN
jgi:hypothetical protein